MASKKTASDEPKKKHAAHISHVHAADPEQNKHVADPDHVPHVSRVEAKDPKQNKHYALEDRVQPEASAVATPEED